MSDMASKRKKRTNSTEKILALSYTVLTGGIFLLFSPPFLLYIMLSGRYKRHLKERLGFYPFPERGKSTGRPTIWIHAASLGEVRVASSIIKAVESIRPGCLFLITTFTEHGRDLAKSLAGKNVRVSFAPLDFLPFVRRALKRVSPELLLFAETEIWPAWIFEAKKMGIKTALINGRISKRSAKSYLALRPLFGPLLKGINAFSMISEHDASRIKAVGAPREKIRVLGNAKYDLMGTLTNASKKDEIRKTLGLKENQIILIAGSTRTGEEELILGAYKEITARFPDTVLIIAPRHLERVPQITSLIKSKGYACRFRKEVEGILSNGKEKVVIINTFGELFDIYSVGTIVFCGASLVPKGGQNPLEPAAWCKMPFYGPYMDDFSDAKDILETAGAGIEVSGPEMLAERAIWFLSNREELALRGKKARQAVLKNHGASVRQAKFILELLEK